jgi:hypothetical protein
MDLGSAVHALTEYYDRGESPEHADYALYAKDLEKWLFEKYQLEVDLMKFLGQWINFRAEYKISKFDYIETAFGSDKYNYATTIDRYFKGTCADVKTGNSYNTHSLQTMAQKLAMEENGVKITRRINVYLKEDSYEVQEHKEDEIDKHNWETCVEYYWLKKRLTEKEKK